MSLTFAGLMTPEGVVVAAGVITSFVALIKAVFPAIDARVSGALMAFALSALLYLASVTAVPILQPDDVLRLVMAWLACATSAVGINSAVRHVNDQRETTRTAYALSNKAPAVPAGAAFGTMRAQDGFAIKAEDLETAIAAEEARLASTTTEQCPTGCGDETRHELGADWQARIDAGEAIPIAGCGNPWHYTEDGRPLSDPAVGALSGTTDPA